MRETTYTCDRCKMTSITNHFLYGIEVSVDWGYRPGWSDTDRRTVHKQEWCQSCLGEFGLVKNRKQEDKIPVPEPTIEDFIRGIVRQEIGG